MLVILLLMPVLLVSVMLLMLMVMGNALHPLFGLLFQGVHAVHHDKAGNILFPARQDLLQPGLALSAVADQQVAVFYTDNVLGRGLKAVGLGAGGHQQRHIGLFPGNFPGKIIGREQSADNIQSLSPALRRAFAAGAEGERKAQDHKNNQTFLHLLSPIHSVIYPKAA